MGTRAQTFRLATMVVLPDGDGGEERGRAGIGKGVDLLEVEVVVGDQVVVTVGVVGFPVGGDAVAAGGV